EDGGGPLLAADRSSIGKSGPEIAEGIEHADAAGVTEIASLLIDAEVEKAKPPAGPQFCRPCQEHSLPIAGALRLEGFAFRALCADHMYVTRDPGRDGRDIVRRGR